MSRRQRALSFEEIEEQYQEPPRQRQRVPIKVDDGDDDSELESSDDDSEFTMTEISPRFTIEVR